MEQGGRGYPYKTLPWHGIKPSSHRWEWINKVQSTAAGPASAFCTKKMKGIFIFCLSLLPKLLYQVN